MLPSERRLNHLFQRSDAIQDQSHLVQFYEDKTYLFEAASLFMSQGLASGDAVIAISRDSHLREIEQRLNRQGVDLQAAKERGQLHLLDIHTTLSGLLVECIPNAEKFQNSIGELVRRLKTAYPGVRVYGEMVDLLCDQGNFAHAAILEEHWNDLIQSHSFRLLCSYSINSFNDPSHSVTFNEVCNAHSHVIPSEDFTTATDEEAQYRKIALLQQQAKALETEKKREQERTELIAREQEARAEAERANLAKDEFLAIISHELRTPLQPIFSWVHLMRMGHLKPAQVERGLQIIERSAKTQAQIINDLLDISRVNSGKMIIEKHRIDLCSVVDAAVDSCALDANIAGIEISSKLEEHLFVQGDPARLQQVLWNLISNAIKFTPKGGRIDIKLENLGSNAKLSVHDTGKGITPDFLPYVFEKFRQENSSRTRPKGGLGLGLALVHWLTQQHDGTITAESEGEGKGSTFSIILPLLANQNLDEHTTREREVEKASLKPLPNLHRLKILVVDDEADTQEAIAVILKECNANVRTASSVPEALKAIHQEIPDLLVSDLGMPDEDGYSLIRKVRALNTSQGGSIPAIALTAFAGMFDVEQVRKAGFQAHLGKPIDAASLSQVVLKVLHSSADHSVKAA